MLSPVDEYADFETFEFVLIPGGGTPDPTEADYVRSGLKRGLEVGAMTGENPFKMGVIGSTDSHTGMSSAEENNFGGKGQHDAEPAQRSHLTGIGDSRGWDMGAAGFAGVLEIPTPRYSLMDAVALGIDPKDTGKPLTIQERVYSSAIWYTATN